MASLTSQLIISLIDKVSGPAKGAAGSLKGVANAAKQIGDAKGADALASSLKKTAAAAAALGKVKPANWSANFDQQIEKLNLTQKQIDRLRGSFEKFQSTLKASGVRKAGDFLPRLDDWERRTVSSLQAATRAHEEHNRKVGRLADIRRGVLHMAAPLVGGYAAAHGAKTAVEKTAELQREKVREDLSGMSPEDRTSSLRLAREISSKYKSVGQVEILEHQRKLRGTLGDLRHAQETVEDIVKSQVVLSASAGGKDSAIRDLDNITKGLEGAGYAGDPEKFRRMLTAFVKGKNVFGETLTGEDFRTYIQRAKTSKYGLSEEYLGAIVPTLLQHEGANQFGTAQATAFNSLVGGRQTKGAKAKLQNFGLLDKSQKLVDQELFVSNPYDWAVKNLLPRMEKAGMSIDTEAGSKEREKAVDFLMKGFSNRNAGEFFAALLANRKVIEKDRTNLKTAKGPEAAHQVIEQDPFSGWEAIKSQTTNLTQNILENAKGAQAALTALADGIGYLAKKLSEASPAVRETIGTGAAAAAAGAGVFATGALAVKGFNWLFGRGSAASGAVDAAIKGAGGGAAAGRLGTAGRLANRMRGGPIGTALSAAELMKLDAANGNVTRTWLRGLLGIEDPGEAAPWAPGGSFEKRQPGWLQSFIDWHARMKEKDAADVARQNASRGDGKLAGPSDVARQKVSPSIVPAAGPAGTAQQIDDVFKKGAEGVQHLDVSAQASAAAAKSGAAFTSTLSRELSGVDAIIDAAVQRWISKLSFNAHPTITPNISAPSAPAAAAPGKGASLQGMKAKQQALYADYGIPDLA